MTGRLRLGVLATTVVAAQVGACATRPPKDWGDFDVLADATPPAPPMMGDIPITNAEDYQTLLRWGESWFRDGAFGDDKAVSDVLGILGGTVQVPCAASSDPACRADLAVFPQYAAAVDALDGVEGNLFQGNGGAYTSDLVIRFPAGTTLFGSIPVPERLFTGFDIEAGAFWPIGLVPVVPKAGEPTKHLVNLATLTHNGALYADAPAGPIRTRLTCAFCHYSLDVDRDGTADLRSAGVDTPTPGSPYGPQHAWGVGNQDLEFGWLLALSDNPLFGSIVYSGSPGQPGPAAAVAFQSWVLANYETTPQDVLREVSIGMVTQPRGYTDVVPDGMLGSIQFPTLYTRRAWPANTDGAQTNESDRNNSVWTGALDFTSLVDLTSDRGSKVKQPWEADKVFDHVDALTFGRLVTRYSPAGKNDPAFRAAMIDDILGTSDGVPGMIDADSMVIMDGPALPSALLTHPANLPKRGVKGDKGRIRRPADYPGDGRFRGFGMAALGMRIGLDPAWKERIEPYATKYGIYRDDFMNEGVSLMLNWMDPPPNNTPLLAHAVGLVATGQKVFRDAGCEQCHRGPFGTDNRIYRLSDDESVVFGGYRAPTTAGWRVQNRGQGPAINTQPDRSQGSRALRRFASAPYDPRTGKAYFWSGPLNGFVGAQPIGYKTTALRFLWGSAPYLHDGGVGVAIQPGAAPEGTDLQALLRRAGGDDLVYGMGRIVELAEPDPVAGPRANAALSLQALVLKRERDRVIDHNERPELLVLSGSRVNPAGKQPIPDHVSAASVGVHGVGHEFWVDDVPGGDNVTALVAYLLALDDCPRDLPGGTASMKCPGYDWANTSNPKTWGYP